MYRKIESKKNVFVIKHNGDVIAYHSKDCLDYLFYNENIILNAKTQKNQNIKEIFYDRVSEFSIPDEELEYSDQFYLAYDLINDSIKILPLSFSLFKIPRFDSRENAQKAINIAYLDFNQKQRTIIFTEN